MYSLLSVLSFAASSVLGKKIQQSGFTTVNLLLWRYGIALFCGIMIISYRKSSLTFDKKAMVKAFCTAIAFYSGATFCYFYSFNHLATGLSSVICSVNTVFVALILWVWDKQKITLGYAFAIFITCIGFYFILKTHKDGHVELYGVFLAVLSGFSYALYLVFNRNKVNKLDPILSATMLFLGNFFVYLTSFLITGDVIVVPNNFNLWVMVLLMAVCCTLLPIYLLLKALSYLNARDVSLIGVLRPVFVNLFAFVFLHETISTTQAIGIAFILCGASLNQLPGIKYTR
jgi:drug/metabolite transporter (DMT)-like permease